MPRSNLSQIRFMAALWCVLWVLYTLLNSIHALIDHRTTNVAAWEPILWESSSIAVIAVLFFAVWRFNEHFPFARDTWPRRLLQHGAAAVLFSLCHTLGMFGLRFAVYALLDADYVPVQSTTTILLYEFSKDVPTYVSLVVVASMLRTHQFYRDQVLANLNLAKELALLEGQRMREQLRPHFLFNTLNLISATMYEDVDKADRLLANLSALLRHSLAEAEQVCIPLERELHYLELYLGLVGERFDGRTTFAFAVPDDLATALIPRFLLQPLAENAIHHGFRDRDGGGHIVVRAHAEDDRLLLDIEDNGVGLAAGGETALGQGIGLSNTVKTLRHLYGEAGRLQLLPVTDGGLCVRLQLPLSRQIGQEAGDHAFADHG